MESTNTHAAYRSQAGGSALAALFAQTVPEKAKVEGASRGALKNPEPPPGASAKRLRACAACGRGKHKTLLRPVSCERV